MSLTVMKAQGGQKGQQSHTQLKKGLGASKHHLSDDQIGKEEGGKLTYACHMGSELESRMLNV